MARRSDIQKLIATHEHRLQLLQERQARQGIETPPDVIIEIEEIQEVIAKLKAELPSESAPDEPDAAGGQSTLPNTSLSEQYSPVAKVEVAETSSQKDMNLAAPKRQIDTKGGAYFEFAGPVSTQGGDIVGRDKKTYNVSTPTSLAVILVIIVLASLTALILYVLFPEWFTTPVMPEGAFNIAVAQFISADDTTHWVDEATAQRLSNILFGSIQRKIRQNQGIVLWEPAQAGPISGSDPLIRAANAEKIAPAKNMSLLIYGVIRPTAEGYQLEPEFYISPEGFTYAPELLGPNKFGRAILVRSELLNNPSNRAIAAELDTQLEVESFQQLILGLADFYDGEYNQAYLKFALAADIIAEDEVIYLLMGAAKLRAYGPGLPEGESLLLAASKAFSRAAQINPNYARSYLGLGAVAMQQAVRPDPVDEAELTQAERWYQVGLNLPDQPPSAHIPIKSYYGLGQVYWYRYQPDITYDRNQLCPYILNSVAPDPAADQARHYYQAVFDGYQANPSNELAWFAGHALAQAGWIEGSQGNWAGMTANSQEAIRVLSRMAAPPQDWIALYWSWAAEAEICLNNLAKACNFFERALLAGENVDPARRRAFTGEQLVEWQAQLDRLGCSK